MGAETNPQLLVSRAQMGRFRAPFLPRVSSSTKKMKEEKECIFSDEELLQKCTTIELYIYINNNKFK